MFQGKWTVEVDKDQRGKFIIYICKIKRIKDYNKEYVQIAEVEDMLSYGLEPETFWKFEKEADLSQWVFEAHRKNLFDKKEDAQRRLMFLMWEYKGRYS